MSEFDYEDEDQFVDEPKQNPLRQALKQKEKETADLAKRLAEAESAKRELAFMKAGINPDDPTAKYFVKAYDGDLEPEAIKSAALEARLISPPDNSAEKDAWNRTNQVAAGAQTAHNPVDWAKRISEAETPDEVEQIMAEIRAEQNQ